MTWGKGRAGGMPDVDLGGAKYVPGGTGSSQVGRGRKRLKSSVAPVDP